MPKFTDLYEDTLDVRLSAVNTVLLEVEAVDDGETIMLAFDPEPAVEIAKALLETAGRRVVPIDAASAANMTFNEAMLRLAAIHKRTVAFAYAKDKGQFIENRRLNPTTVETTAKGDIVARGLDPDREDVRQYRLDRIKGEVTLA